VGSLKKFQEKREVLHCNFMTFEFFSSLHKLQ
jgi:hypothetical protein